jgi:hypothetical protein
MRLECALQSSEAPMSHNSPSAAAGAASAAAAGACNSSRFLSTWTGSTVIVNGASLSSTSSPGQPMRVTCAPAAVTCHGSRTRVIQLPRRVTTQARRHETRAHKDTRTQTHRHAHMCSSHVHVRFIRIHSRQSQRTCANLPHPTQPIAVVTSRALRLE